MPPRKLPIGVYDIPPDCRAVVREGRVAVIRRASISDTPRCTSCCHCVKGKSSRAQLYAHPVCTLRPKTYTSPEISNIYYAVQRYDTACDKYTPSTNQSSQ